MKTNAFFNSKVITVIGSAVLVVNCYSVDVESNSDSVGKDVPKSIFVVPKDPKEVRDPFYPNSSRLFPRENLPKVVAPVKIALVLNGLSGVTGHRLAMINGRTMAEGESSDVPTGGSLVKVRCVEIKDNSAVVEVNGTRQELSMSGEK